MTKKDYIEISNIIKHTTIFENNQPLDKYIDKERLVNALSGYFAEDNPRFNHLRFADACKVG